VLTRHTKGLVILDEPRRSTTQLHYIGVSGERNIDNPASNHEHHTTSIIPSPLLPDTSLSLSPCRQFRSAGVFPGTPHLVLPHAFAHGSSLKPFLIPGLVLFRVCCRRLVYHSAICGGSNFHIRNSCAHVVGAGDRQQILCVPDASKIQILQEYSHPTIIRRVHGCSALESRVVIPMFMKSL
jgi:hypothetical protein